MSDATAAESVAGVALTRAAQPLRITVRPFDADDAADVAPWLEEAMAAIDGRTAAPTPNRLPAQRSAAPAIRSVRGSAEPSTARNVSLEAFQTWHGERWPGAEARVIVAGDWGVVGFVIGQKQQLEGMPAVPAWVIHALAMRRDARNLGYGVEALEWLEAGAPATTFYAPIPRGNGLAVYFWLHAGFRPLRFDEAPLVATDATRLWCVRKPGGGAL